MRQIELDIAFAADGRLRTHVIFRRSGCETLRYATGDGSGSSVVREIFPHEVRCIVCALVSGLPDHAGPDVAPRVAMKVTRESDGGVGKEYNVVSGDGGLRILLRDAGTGVSESMDIRFGELKCFFCLLFNRGVFPEHIREIGNVCPDLCRAGCPGLPFIPKNNHKAPS